MNVPGREIFGIGSDDDGSGALEMANFEKTVLES